MGEKNIRVEFRAAEFISYNPEIVISRLDFKSKTPMLLDSHLTNIKSINLNTSKTIKNII